MIGRQALSAMRAGGALGRRDFLAVSGLGIASLLFLPGRAQASPVFSAAKRLASAVQAVQLTDNIGAFIRRNEIPKQTALEVERVNCTARGESFSDFSQSVVFVPKAERTYFFYLLGNKDGFNAAVSFFDRKRKPDTQYVGVLGGPTLFGVAELAASIARNNSPFVVRNSILPREVIHTSGISLGQSYSRPDEYRTDAGTVRADYRTDGRGRGVVTVEARSDRGTLLAGGDYDLEYRSAE